MNAKPPRRRRVIFRWIVPALSVLVLILLFTCYYFEPVHRWVGLGSEYDGHFFMADSRITVAVLIHDSTAAGFFPFLRFPLLPSFTRKVELAESIAKLEKQREELLQRAREPHDEDSMREEMRAGEISRALYINARVLGSAVVAQDQGVNSAYVMLMSREVRDLVRKRGYWGLLFTIKTKLKNSVVLSVPFWLPVGVAAMGILIPIYRWVRPRRFRNPIACRRCQYILRGLTRMICPECGLAISERQWRLIAEDAASQEQIGTNNSVADSGDMVG